MAAAIFESIVVFEELSSIPLRLQCFSVALCSEAASRRRMLNSGVTVAP